MRSLHLSLRLALTMARISMTARGILNFQDAGKEPGACYWLPLGASDSFHTNLIQRSGHLA